jgi:hypothetical protein
LKVDNAFAGPWWAGGLAFSPDGHYLVYVGIDGDHKELFALPLKGRDYAVAQPAVAITHFDGNGEPFWPTFTKDGLLLSYGLSIGNSDIFIADIDVGSLTISGELIPVAVDLRNDLHPCWLPDGQGVIFCSMMHDQMDLYKFDLATHETKRLTFTSEVEKFPQLSPDGKIISFYADEALWSLPIEGGPKKRLTPQGLRLKGLYAGRHVWSLDQSQIFIALEDSLNPWLCALIQIDLSSGHYHMLQNGLYFNCLDIAASPDGKSLAFSGMLDTLDLANEYFGIYDLEKKTTKTILHQRIRIPRGRISWMPDGSNILRDHNVPPGMVFELIPVNGGPVKELKMKATNLQGSVFIDKIDPSGKKVLLKLHNEEADIWLRGLR